MGRGVKIPITISKEKAQADAKEFSDDLKKGMKEAAAGGVILKEALDAIKASVERWIAIGKEAVAMSADLERQEVRTRTALELRGKFSEQDFVALTRQNEARRQWSAVGQAEQLQLEGTASMLGVKTEHLNRVINATINLSNITGKDLHSSLTSVVKLYEGNTNALKRMGIVATSVQDGFQQLAGKTDVVKATMETFSGRMSMLKSDFDELMIALGDAIVRNADVKLFLDDLSKAMKEMLAEVIANGPAFKAKVSEIVSELRAFGAWIKDNKEELKEFIHALSTLAKIKLGASIVKGLVTGLEGLMKARAVLLASGFLGTGGLLAGGALAGAGAVGYSIGSALTMIPGVGTGIGDYFANKSIANAKPWEPQGPGVDFAAMNANIPGGGGNPNADLSGIESEEQKRKKEEARKAALAAIKAAHAKEEEHRLRHLKWLKRWQEEHTRVIVENRAKQRKVHQDLLNDLHQDEVEQMAERNRARIHGFRNAEELRRAELIAGRQFAQSEKEMNDERTVAMAQFWDQQIQTAAQGLGTMVAGMTQGLIDGKETAAQAMKQFLGGMLAQLGSALIAMGSAAVAAGFLGTVSPPFLGITGGPAAVAAGLGLIAAGGVLTGLGGAVGASGGAKPSSGPAGGYGAPGFGSGFSSLPYGGASAQYGGGGAGSGPRVTLVNVSIDGARGFLVGNSSEVARYLSDLLGAHAGYGVG